MKVLEHLEKNTIHLTLLDPDKQAPVEAGKIAKAASSGGTDGIMVGGSQRISQENLDATVSSIKANTNLPVILFPGGVSGISKHADAIFFMSMLNSKNPYFITGAQAIGAPIVKMVGIEPISMGYIVVEPGGAVGKVGEAELIPRDKPEVAAGYALAAQYLGMRLIYLEAGSGADRHVPAEMISAVKEAIDVLLIVGGGIMTGEDAKAVRRAGADIIVTGTLVEQVKDVEGKIKEITGALK
ncbi:geranylgeranylglyceryl/heptaprenylglyceryl phosphate synthase [archaeon]|nr:geranylgeranylglyceryl/heptaprenylglyceryl phosphate synthase [archaeon]